MFTKTGSCFLGILCQGTEHARAALTLHTQISKKDIAMDHSKPTIPQPPLGANPPRYRRVYRQVVETAGTGTIVGVAVALTLIIALVLYSTSLTTRTVTHNPPPSTIGQGTTPTAPSVLDTNQGVPPGVMLPEPAPTPPNLDSK